MFRIAFFFTAIAWLSAVPVPLVAAEPHPLDAFFNGKQNSCYRRAYSKKHMATHPDQTVERISFEHFPKDMGEIDENDQVVFNNETHEVFFVIEVTFKSSKKIYSEAGTCWREGKQLQCGIECDGGGFHLQARKDGRLLLKTGGNGFRVITDDGGCDGDANEINTTAVTRKTDDKEFLLDLVPDNQCVLSEPIKSE